MPGFYEFLEAMANPTHPDHEDRLDWYGGTFDPGEFERDRIHKAIPDGKR